MDAGQAVGGPQTPVARHHKGRGQQATGPKGKEVGRRPPTLRRRAAANGLVRALPQLHPAASGHLEAHCVGVADALNGGVAARVPSRGGRAPRAHGSLGKKETPNGWSLK